MFSEKLCANMGHLFIYLAVALMSCAAELEYFPHHWRNVTWDEARRHCQVCFKDLVTVTADNIQTVSQNLTFDYWVGLRKNSSSNSSLPWSHWANGDPLLFQNWYPGRPVSRSSLPRRYCCGCSATTIVASTSPDVTNSAATSTSPEVEGRCAYSPVLLPDVPDDYVEDACVAMLSFGAWVERDCSDRLSFICYEEHLAHRATVTQLTSESAVVSWRPGPGAVSHYNITVAADKDLNYNLTMGLSYNLTELTAGVRHSVQVFPVKCGRKLTPQEVHFYTKPNKVGNLTVDDVTETSVFLSWSEPAGNVDFYVIEVQGEKRVRSVSETAEVDGLIPGNFYVFTVQSGVGATRGEASNTTAYTKPGKVTDLEVTENTMNSLLLSWTPPEGNASGYWVTARNECNDTLFDDLVSQTEVKVVNLTAGSEMTLSVAALANSNTLYGEAVTVVSHTVPGAISALTLVPSHDSISATWEVSAGSYSYFIVELLEDKRQQTVFNLTFSFDGLKTAARYTVTVHMVSGDLSGPTRQNATFTLPWPPSHAEVVSRGKTWMTLQWKAPDDIVAARYNVSMTTSFWHESRWVIVEDKTTNTFEELRSGTRYDFEVRTVTAEASSTPSNASDVTVAEKREIILSMICSSAEPLLCDQTSTQDSVFQQLRDHFNDLLGDLVFWELEKQETERK